MANTRSIVDTVRNRPLVQVLALATAPAIGLGIARFAYALLLPDMQQDLDWSWTVAGWMNTSNALGYLGGALLAARAASRFGATRTTLYGTLACVISLGLCALLRDTLLLNLARILAGLGAGFAFVAGGTLAAGIASRQRTHSGLLLGLYYAGPGCGIALSGLAVPWVLQQAGPGSWALAWGVLAALSIPLTLILALGSRHQSGTPAQAAASATQPAHRMLPLLIGYFLFGAGYIAYMTFMIAWVRDAGESAGGQALFWISVGGAAMATPWLWSGVLERRHHGQAFALLSLLTAIGAALPLIVDGVTIRLLSAVTFGGCFFGVVASTTAFVRRNLAPPDWGRAIGTLTVCFGVGQILGPIAAGFLTDRLGGLSSGLTGSALLLFVGAGIGYLQRDMPAGRCIRTS